MSLSLSSSADVFDAVRRARDVTFGSYLLPAGPARDALVAASRRGAHVRVTLQADPYHDPAGARINAAAAAALRSAGASVTLERSDQVAFHLKAAVCDGVAYLDDRNWPRRGGVIVRDDSPDDVALVREALAGRAGADETLATRKDVALARAAALIDAAPLDTPVVVATESFGGGALSAALGRRAAANEPATLIVDPHRLNGAERSVVASLSKAGVRIADSRADEKFVLAGDTAWVGSANATYAGDERGDQVEWGIVTRDPRILSALRAQCAGVTDGAGALPAPR